MNNLTPETLEFDPGRISIWSGWLVYDVGYHTCGGYGPESGYMHEPGCGAEPMCKVADIPDILAAAAERDALAAKLDTVREWIDRRGVNVDDRDDDYMRGYRDAQRHARLDANELRALLDATPETGGES